MTSITVHTKPADIPSHFDVDITDLTVGTSITVSQLVLPDGVTTDVDPDAAIVSGVATRFTAEGEGAEGEGAEGEGAEGEEGAAASAEGGEAADAAEGGE
jgi:large subunit ribosomal protein L25